MSTRSLTIFMLGDDKEVVMYRHSDGYPDGHGKELANFLLGLTIVNGINYSEKGKIANGMSCLAAQVVCHFKQQAGHKDNAGLVYLYESGKRDLWEDYIYYVYGDVGQEPKIKVDNFDGSPSEFLQKLESGFFDGDES